MGWEDEKELVILSVIMLVIITVSLDFYLGILYSILTFAYIFSIGKPWTIQFSKDRKYFNPNLIMVGILTFLFMNVVSSTMHNNIINSEPLSIIPVDIDEYNITNPLIKLSIWEQSW